MHEVGPKRPWKLHKQRAMGSAVPYRFRHLIRLGEHSVYGESALAFPHLILSWPGLTRPSIPTTAQYFEMDDRLKAGHDNLRIGSRHARAEFHARPNERTIFVFFAAKSGTSAEPWSYADS